MARGNSTWTDRGFTTYGAWDGDELVAAATRFLATHSGAVLGGAATLPGYRGRGAQPR